MSMLTNLTADIQHMCIARPLGRISRLSAASLEATGLSEDCGVGDLVQLLRGSMTCQCEVVGISGTGILLLPEGDIKGFRVGDPVVPAGPRRLCPDESWLGRLIDPAGRPLDGRPLAQGPRRDLNAPAPEASMRKELGPRLHTGLAAIDTLLPIVRGQRMGVFAGAGVGKSTLIGQLATEAEADVVVMALVGERGREVGDVFTRLLGSKARQRSVVIAATSDQSAMLRRQAVASAVTVAEFFRDQGKHVLLLVDSVTRLAEAHREIALQAGEAPAMRGHPPSLVPLLAQLAERTGPGKIGSGDITAIFSVLVAGDDLDEPVADVLRGQLDGHIVLSRDIAERGRFPAIDVLKSVSRALPAAATETELELIAKARHVLSEQASAQLMVRSGLYQGGSDQDLDQVLAVFPMLDGYLGTVVSGGRGAAYAALANCLATAQDDQETVGDA